MCFSGNIAKFLRAAFFYRISLVADFEAGIKHLSFRKELLLHINGPRRRSKEFKVITVWVNGYWLDILL